MGRRRGRARILGLAPRELHVHHSNLVQHDVGFVVGDQVVLSVTKGGEGSQHGDPIFAGLQSTPDHTVRRQKNRDGAQIRRNRHAGPCFGAPETGRQHLLTRDEIDRGDQPLKLGQLVDGGRHSILLADLLDLSEASHVFTLGAGFHRLGDDEDFGQGHLLLDDPLVRAGHLEEH